MADISLHRTFWPVGHGAFYSEQFYSHRTEKTFCAIYDCGGKDNETIERNIDRLLHRNKVVDFLFISHLHKDHINGLPYLYKNGIVQQTFLPLLSHVELVETYVYNAIHGESDGEVDVDSEVQQFVYEIATGVRSFDTRLTFVTANPIERNEDNKGYHPSRSPIELPSLDDEKPFWVYIPVHVKYDEKKCVELVESLCGKINANIKNTNGDIVWKVLQATLRAADKKQLKLIKDIYRKLFNGNHNAYSMPVYSGPIEDAKLAVYDSSFYYDLDHFWLHRFGYPYTWHHRDIFRRVIPKRLLPCLYMGDFEAKDEQKFSELKRQLNKYYHMVGIQQVPHHFSPYNHNAELYLQRFWAFGNVDDNGDVSFGQSVSWEIENLVERPIIITEQEDTQFTFRCDFVV